MISIVKMATVLEKCTAVKQRSVVRFLWSKGLNEKDIHEEIFPVNGGKCLPLKAVHNLVEKFSQGRSKVAYDVRPSRPVEIAAEATVQRVDMLIRANRRTTIDSEEIAPGCSHGLAYSIMHDRLTFQKMRAVGAPRTEGSSKMNQMSLSLQHLLRYADEGEDMLNRIVTEDESWVHHCLPESKRASMQWKHPSSHAAKMFKVTPTAGKFMLAMFWD
jgi:hypothetical protein